MRRPYFPDVSAAALALVEVDAEEREVLCRTMIREADLADRFARRLGKPHPWWGGGSLMDAAARRAMAQERALDDPDFRACLILVLQHLGHRPRSSVM